VVAPAEVDPLQVGNEFTKAFLETGKRLFEVVAVLFAKRVEVQTLNAIEGFPFEFAAQDAKT
jgi:hypothetical protein